MTCRYQQKEDNYRKRYCSNQNKDTFLCVEYHNNIPCYQKEEEEGE